MGGFNLWRLAMASCLRSARVQSQYVADALAAANKSYKLVLIDGTDHYFQNQGPQRQLFDSITAFLKENLGAPAN